MLKSLTSTPSTATKEATDLRTPSSEKRAAQTICTRRRGAGAQVKKLLTYGHPPPRNVQHRPSARDVGVREPRWRSPVHTSTPSSQVTRRAPGWPSTLSPFPITQQHPRKNLNRKPGVGVRLERGSPSYWLSGSGPPSSKRAAETLQEERRLAAQPLHSLSRSHILVCKEGWTRPCRSWGDETRGSTGAAPGTEQVCCNQLSSPAPRRAQPATRGTRLRGTAREPAHLSQ